MLLEPSDGSCGPALAACAEFPPPEPEVPPEDEDCWDVPDPDTGRPAELAGLAGEELDALASPPFRPPGAAWPEGIVPPSGPPGLPAGVLARDGTGGGSGFADGGVLDVAAPGVALAACAEDAHAALGDLDDDCLVGVIRAWRRLASWASGRELAAVAELARRRPAEGSCPDPVGPGGFPLAVSEFTADEIAAALTLTVHAAGAWLDLALALAARLPGTAAALAAGRLDLARTKVIADGTAELAAGHAAAVEAAVLPAARGMTTGQLRAAVARAVLAAGPQAARRRREEAEKDARVECWTSGAGTAALAGRDLPSAPALAADRRISAIAVAWKKQGAAGGMDLLRAHAYLALLNGQDISLPPASLLPPGTPAPDPGHPDDSAQQVPAGLRRPQSGLPPLAGSVTLTIPLATLIGLADSPGEAPGYGPLDPGTARALACAAAGHRSSRWHVTITGPSGQALAHGTAGRRRTGHGPQGWTVRVTAEPIAAGSCGHPGQEPGYEPSPALRRLVRARATTCTYPGCRRPAAGCDLDHSLAYDDGGITCQCNLAPLCRRHHRLKQSEGWTLQQPTPGIMAWLTPAGRRYTTLPSQHPQ